jgi:hypothetical protein
MGEREDYRWGSEFRPEAPVQLGFRLGRLVAAKSAAIPGSPGRSIKPWSRLTVVTEWEAAPRQIIGRVRSKYVQAAAPVWLSVNSGPNSMRLSQLKRFDRKPDHTVKVRNVSKVGSHCAWRSTQKGVHSGEELDRRFPSISPRGAHSCGPFACCWKAPAITGKLGEVVWPATTHGRPGQLD